MKYSLFLSLLFLSFYSKAQLKRLDAYLNIGTYRHGTIMEKDQINRLLRFGTKYDKSFNLGLNFYSIGYKPKQKVFLKHGVNISGPFYSNTNLSPFPSRSYLFLNNSVGVNFLNTKQATSYFMLESKINLQKASFDRKEEYLNAKNNFFMAELGVQPLPYKNPVRITFNFSITPAFVWESVNTSNRNIYFSTIGLNYRFR